MTAFRRATDTDVPTLSALQQAFFEDLGDPLDVTASIRAMRELISDPSLGRLLVIEDAGAVAGYLAIAFGFSLELGGRDAFIDELYIVPNARGHGAGTEALRVAEEVCREAGVRAMLLEVGHRNPRARALYERSGFVTLERDLMTKRL